MMKPPKKIRVHGCHNQISFLTKKQEKIYCRDCDAVPAKESKMFVYILLSEHEKEIRELIEINKGLVRSYKNQLAGKDRMIAALAERLPIPKNVKMVKLH